MQHTIHLFGIPFLVCLGMIAILAYVGIHILKREIIFIDIALAQIAAVGTIVAHLIMGAHGDSVAGYVSGIGFAVVASLLYAFIRRRVTQISLEAVIGVSYAIAAAAVLFLVGVAPGGHMHVQHMLAGSILWATWADVLWCAAVFPVVGLLFVVFRKPFRRISEDYDSAAAGGMPVVLWDFIFYVLVSAVITLAVRLAGVVLVFALLVIPATISALVTSRWGVRLAVGWASGTGALLLGLAFSHVLDFSVGPSIALFLGLTLGAVALLGASRAA